MPENKAITGRGQEVFARKNFLKTHSPLCAKMLYFNGLRKVVPLCGSFRNLAQSVKTQGLVATK
jgi:hypothetical protein